MMTRFSIGRFSVGLIVAVALAAASSAQASVVGLLNDFQDGMFGFWDSAGLNEYSIVNDGGPAGAGDRAMQIEFSQRVTFFNEADWSGNYTTGGVTNLSMDIKHSNLFNLELRVGIAKGPTRPGPGGNGDTYVTDYSVSVPNDGQWHHVVFDIEADDFVVSSGNFLPGPGGAAAALTDVYQFRIIHRPIDDMGGDDFDWIGEFEGGAILLVDNILAEGDAVPVDADFDNDGDVDGEDFLDWQRGLGAGNNSTGDADGNGQVDGADLDIWEAEFGPAATPAAAAIPEPAALALAAAAIGLFGVRRRLCGRRR